MRWTQRLLLVGIMTGCNASFEETKTLGTTPEDVPVISVENDADATEATETPNLQEALEGRLIRVSYALKVTAGSFQICDGEINLRFNPLFTDNGKIFEMPSSPVSCAAGLKQFDVAQMMGAMGETGATGQGVSGLKVKNHVVGLEQLLSGRYQPARPLFPSIIAAPIEELAKVKIAQPTKFMDTTTNSTAQGVIALSVMQVGQSWRAKGGQQFADVLTYRVENRGFVGVDLIKHFLFNQMEVGVSLNPIAITQLKLTGKVKDFQSIAGGTESFSILSSLGIDSASAGGIMGTLVTLAGEYIKTIDVTLELELIEMEGLQ